MVMKQIVQYGSLPLKVYSKMLGKAKATCNKVYNKYYGYSDLPKKQIDKIAEYAYQRYIETKDVSSKREEFNKSTMSKLKSNSDLEGIEGIKKFVESRGYTAENYDNMDFYEINQGLTMQPQDDDDVVADIPSGYCDLNCYTIAAASALLFAMCYMLALDNEVSYHGFGPSGFQLVVRSKRLELSISKNENNDLNVACLPIPPRPQH